MRTPLILCILSFAAVTSYAAPEEIELWDFAHPYKQKCSAGNMAEMNSCLAEAYAEVDSRLNIVYKRLMRSLLNPVPLKKAQAAWSRYRDLQCAFEVSPEWTGSAIPYSQNSCLIDHTERRFRDLERIVPCNGCVEFKPEHYK
jgi:uncharacterized protein YecT (DUF1311 family)